MKQSNDSSGNDSHIDIALLLETIGKGFAGLLRFEGTGEVTGEIDEADHGESGSAKIRFSCFDRPSISSCFPHAALTLFRDGIAGVLQA